jgi:RsiW-degrading membrane proteinase PrsW (M82 family)
MLFSLLLGILPAVTYAGFVYWLDHYEKEPLPLLGGVFIWGAVVASAGAFLINTIFGLTIFSLTGSTAAADISTSSFSAPLVEESLKGLAVLLVFWLARSEFDSILDGIIYAAITALGFSATENAYYIYQYGFAESGFSGAIGLAFVRVVLVGWQHPFFTSFIGIGLAVARMTKSTPVKIIAPVAGWLAAVLTHAIHNSIGSLFSGAGFLLGIAIDWTGWLAMLGFTFYLVHRERVWLTQFLNEEVKQGIITTAQYTTACSAIQRTGASFQAIGKGSYRSTQRFYQLCAELAHKKRQLNSHGEESGNSLVIVKLREELAQLSPLVPY